MDISFFSEAAQLGGTVFTVVAFLWYLTRLLKVQSFRDNQSVIALKEQARSNIVLAKALQRMSDIVGLNTIESNKNTASIVKSKSSSDKNTDAIDKNTDVIKNGNGN